ncbi:MAG: DUF4252 domain-containing protein [Saprospiraceae bacterium]|nr:DUF4252 domain-containing protein [Saprospiraceae bacterium]
MKLKFNLIIVMLCLVSMSLQSQNTAVDRHFQDYRHDERYTHVSVSSKMFELFVNFEREDKTEQQIIETISKLQGLKVLVGSGISDAEEVYESISMRPFSDMEELMNISDSNKSFRFFISERDEMIRELAMVGYEGTQVFILSLIGDIDLKEIAALSKKMDLEGFEHFENIDR